LGQKVIPKIVAARAPDANPLRSRRLQSPKNALRHSWREPFIDDQFFLIRPASILRCGLVSALAELAARTVAAAQLVPATSTPSAASHASHTRRRVNRRSRPRCRRADAAVEPSSETVFVCLSLRIYGCIPDCVLQTRVQSAVRLVGLTPSAEAAANTMNQPTLIGGRSRQAGYALFSPTTRMANVPGATAD